jgi:hypothetical protein|tara:strand:+ start:981 stop:1244 length:264 start_codon:yes stop_codon:yes gene_type:complete
MSKDHEIRLSAEAEQILNSETFKQAISNLKEEYIQHWLNNRNIDDVDFREDLHKAVLLLPEIERHIRIIVEKGKLAKSQIEKIKKIG